MAITLDGSNASTVGVINTPTAKSASGASIDFTGIPSGVRRLTFFMSNFGTNGSSNPLVQIGSGSITATGYTSYGGHAGTSGQGGSHTTGFGSLYSNSANLGNGYGVITFLSAYTYVGAFFMGYNSSGSNFFSQEIGSVSLGGYMDRIRFTTVNGTDVYDAGSINIIYE
jgi:hypothetical protein